MKYFSPNILDGSVTTAKLADDAVTRPKMAGASVGNTELVLFSVNTDRLAPQAITRAKLDTSTAGQSGTLLAGTTVIVAVTEHSFFPDIEAAAAGDEQPILTVNVGAPSAVADSPEFRIENTTGGDKNYSVDWRFINA